MRESRYGLLLLILIILSAGPVLAAPFQKKICNLGWEHVHHKYKEELYQRAWCARNGGIIEYQNKDFTRIDCLTDTHAVEFDFANKWHEAIGQALHYSVMSGKKAKIVLILDEPKKQMIYFRRIQRIGKKYNFDFEFVTNDILNLRTN